MASNKLIFVEISMQIKKYSITLDQFPTRFFDYKSEGTRMNN